MPLDRLSGSRSRKGGTVVKMAKKLLAACGVDAVLLGILICTALGGRESGKDREADIGGDAVRGESEEKTVALTFDDGPHPVYTKELLEGLRKRGVKVTFFLMGANAQENQELVQEMADGGHLIGNHGYRHEDMTKNQLERMCESIEKTSRLIQEITGNEPEYVRPPYGSWNEDLEEAIDLTPVFWSVDSLDWKYEDTDQIKRRVLEKVKNGDIILMHDIFSTSVDAALEIVDTLLDRGYTFVTADELIVD